MIRKDNTPRLSKSPALRAAAFGLPVAAMALSTATPAWALSGAVDPTSGLSQLAPWWLGLCESAIIIICMYKGVHAVGEGRSLGPTLIGFVAGTLLAVGGYYGLSHMGVSSSL
ncbi:hypothetical protein [Gluconobacter cerinus]|uniref:hypothetical protein n=1 Tax=Gluconobacter cerinus TaxID=38307 RepID=UPI001B8CDD24|nr:hypothetical protein [Gluconobacter cerinus]MBS0984275.1 hypothetical protein [Gluconobacter cerinus]